MFLLSELHSVFVSRPGTLGIHKTVNETRLKTSLLENFPDAEEQNDGKNVVIIFKKAIQGMIKDAERQRDSSENALILGEAAGIIRKDMFSHKGFTFSGGFTKDCQESADPAIAVNDTNWSKHWEHWSTRVTTMFNSVPDNLF